MPNIPSQDQISQFFVRTVARASAKRGYYGMVHHAAIRLRAFPFLVYSQISRAANFGSRWCNIKELHWCWRRYRTQRQVNRVLVALSQTLLQRKDRQTYGLLGRHRSLSGAQLKPIRFHVLAEVQDESSALLVRFLLFLAFSRIPWSWLRVGSIQKGLQVDRSVAAHLLRWLRGPGKAYTRKQARRAVFWSRSERLRHYRPDSTDPRGYWAQTRTATIPRSGNVQPEKIDLAFAFKAFNKLLTGSGPGGPPGAEGARVSGQLVQCLADRLTMPRAPGAIAQGAGGTPPPAPPSATRCPENVQTRRSARPRITAEKLIDMMPEAMQADMRKRLMFDRSRNGP